MSIVVVRTHEANSRPSTTSASTAHELVSGAGTTRNLVRPYHAWTYDLDGHLTGARRTGDLIGFDTAEICLDEVRSPSSAGSSTSIST